MEKFKGYNTMILKIRKTAFMNATNLINYMNKYLYYMKEEDLRAIETFAEFSDGLPLPSGRWGNAIALALEANNYLVAEYLIEHAEELKLQTNYIVSEYGYKNPWTLKDEYLFSQLTNDDTVRDKLDCQSFEEYNIYLQSVFRNKAANQRLEEKLCITQEDLPPQM